MASNTAKTTASLPTGVAFAQAAMALRISSQEWGQLGLGDEPDIAASTSLDVTADRLTSLLLIRVVAWLQPPDTYTDLSTTTICRQTLSESSGWPEKLTQQVMDELKHFVEVMLKGYRNVPYHNFEHCYHVTISVNKILDMIMEPLGNPDEASDGVPPETYGFKDDPLMQLALMFAALVHDVEHRGIPNRQLADEDDELAIQFNDTCIMEQNSLFVAFSELLTPKYEVLRDTVFPEDEDYRRFRKAVVNLVLCTDIADPGRSQLSKSKWKEAFGDPYETVERKVRKAYKDDRLSSNDSRSKPKARGGRRMSVQTIMSDLSHESSSAHIDDDIQDLSDDSSVSLSPDESAEDSETKLFQVTAAGRSEPAPGSTVEKKCDYYTDLNAGGSSEMVPQSSQLYLKFEVPLNSDRIQTLAQPRSINNPLPLRNKPRRVKKGMLKQHITGTPPDRQQNTDERSSDGSSGRHSTGAILTTRRMSGMVAKFHRRLSNNSRSRRRTLNTRLGLLRTVDLTGEQIQSYSTHRRASAVGGLAMNSVDGKSLGKATISDEANELRETVIMETILLACDVAHNLQGWEQMEKWSNRLFLELRRAYVNHRGTDPTHGWYRNQFGFLEAYLLPLARKLDDTGVFGDNRGSMFADTVDRLRDRWSKEGMSVTARTITEGVDMFPDAESDTEPSFQG